MAYSVQCPKGLSLILDTSKTSSGRCHHLKLAYGHRGDLDEADSVVKEGPFVDAARGGASVYDVSRASEELK